MEQKARRPGTSATVSRKGFDGLIDGSRQVVPEFSLKFSMLATSRKQAFVGSLCEHFDNGPKVCAQQASEVFELSW
jgi:hypothetical protein